MSAKTKQVDEKWLLDWGARIGVAARRDGVKASQLENLIASLDSVEEREALLVTAAYALRQMQRLGVGRTMARLVAQALRELYERDGGKEEARKMIGFAKWVFEAVGTQRVSGDLSQLSLEELLKQLAGAR